MRPRSLFWIAALSVLGIALSATNWLPLSFGQPLGFGAFLVLVLSAVGMALRFSAKRKKAGVAFFVSGMFLLLIATPLTEAMTLLFSSPLQHNRGSSVPVEIVFGVLGVACVFRAWMIWASFDEEG